MPMNTTFGQLKNMQNWLSTEELWFNNQSDSSDFWSVSALSEVKRSRSAACYKIKDCLQVRTNMSSSLMQKIIFLKKTHREISQWIGQIKSIPRIV